jgi:hypothetical protein
VASAAGFTRNSFGRSSQRLSRAPSLRQRSYTGHSPPWIVASGD